MAEYRLFFLHLDGGIEGRSEFTAADDEVAWRIASILAAHCSDQHHGWMLWQGSHRLFETERIDGDGSLSSVGETPLTDAENRVVEGCAEALLASLWPLAKSERLKAALAVLRERRAASPSGAAVLDEASRRIAS